jgi:hypothetical protein
MEHISYVFFKLEPKGENQVYWQKMKMEQQ